MSSISEYIGVMQGITLGDLLKQQLLNKRFKYPVNIALVGATGVGKSSTINAILGEPWSEVGEGSTPQTQRVKQYRLSQKVRFYDTAGFGDSKEADNRHARNLVRLLNLPRKNLTHLYKVDLVLVILDGGSRDLGTAYKLITDIILPNIEPSRVLIIINKADMAMSGRHWDFEKNEPQPRLIEFLNEKVHSTKERIKEATGLTIPTPIYYSAERDYNIDEIFGFIINNLPQSRRYIS